MAKKIKFSNEQQSRFSRPAQTRLRDVRAKRRYYLIVCEGAKTEPNYFEGLKNDLPRGVLTAFQIDVEGTGRNTLSLIDEAVRLKVTYERETSRPVDRLWVVFDRDSFSANDFNNAVERCRNIQPSIGCAWSNEAFELWYLLHFHYYNNSISRRDYQRMIEENLRPHLGQQYRYLKNSRDMYQLLKQYGNVDNAIKNAKRLKELFEERTDYASHNPSTRVYELIEELIQLNNEI